MQIEELSPKKLALLKELLRRDGVDASILPVTRVKRDGAPAPLSFAQEQLWILHGLDPGSHAYNVHVRLPIDAALSREIVERALQQICNRHDVLRSRYPAGPGGQPVQIVVEDRPLALAAMDLSHLRGDQQARAFQDASRQAARMPFDLAAGPVLRATLVRLDERRQTLLLTMHHIVTDGWSTGLLIRELREHIAAQVEHRLPHLAPLPVQYADYAEWQRSVLVGSRLEAHLQYWRGQLEGAPRLELPLDRSRPAVPSCDGGVESAFLDAPLADALRGISRSAGVTLFTTLLVAFNVFLRRYSGRRDVVVGVPVANRSRPELQALIGFFVNMVAIRSTIDDAAPLTDLLRQVHATVSDSFAHHDVPFEKVVADVAGDRALSRNPIFQTVFSFLDEHTALGGTPVAGDAAQSGDQTTRFDLEAHVLETPEGLRVRFIYATDLFDAATVRAMLSEYVRLLRAVSVDPSQQIAALASTLGDEEHRRVIVDWNATERDYPGSSIAALFEAQAAARPGAIAVESGPHRVSYVELNARANRIGRALRREGVRLDSRVGVMLDRGVDLIATLLGILKAGGAYVVVDPSDPPARIEGMLADAGARLVVAPASAVAAIPRACRRFTLDAVDGAAASNLDVSVPLDALAYIAFTSGSTGRPKGVEVPHRGVVRLLFGSSFAQFGPRETGLQLAPVGFDASTFEIWGALLHGGRLVVYPDRVPAPAELGRVLHERGVTTLWLTSALFNTIVDQAPDALGGVRQLLVGGEALSVPHIERGLALLPSTTIVNGYGPTENTTFTCCFAVPRDGAARFASIPLGAPIANTRVYVLDRRGEPVGSGRPGELFVGGAGLARGYAASPRLTAERFVPDAVSGAFGGRLYRTGDIGRWRHDGTLAFQGRADDQIKLRGFRIEVGEIEGALGRLPDVASAAVALRGEGERKRLVAYVVPRGDATRLTREAIRGALRQAVPSYMVPAAIVVLRALPLNVNGKLDRDALPDPPEADAVEAVQSAPRNDVEATLARIWSSVLRRPAGIHDDFFELGGDSILAIQIVSRALEAGIQLKPKHLFQHPTIAELGGIAVPATAVARPAGGTTGSAPLTPIQHWFLDPEPVDPHHFNQAVMLQMSPGVDLDRIAHAVDLLPSHHEILRARFSRGADGWRQEILGASGESCVTRISLATMSEEEQQAAMIAECTRAQTSFDLGAGPLFQGVLFDVGAARPARLLLVAHHLVVDGVSWRILADDLRQLYAQLSNGRVPELPGEFTPFSQWAAALAAWPVAADEAGYWLDQIERFAPPADRAVRDADGPASPIHRIRSGFDSGQTQALLAAVPKALNATTFEILLAALLRACQCTGATGPVSIDVEGHGRNGERTDIDVSRTVGWFTTIYPLGFDTSRPRSVEATLREVTTAVRGVPNHGIGYGLLKCYGSDDVRRRLCAAGDAPMALNYLGQFDQLFPDGSPFSVAPDPVGPLHSARMRLRHAVEINAFIFDGTLRVEWTYDDRRAPAEMESLAVAFASGVTELIDAAARASEIREAAAGDAGTAGPNVAPERLHVAERYPDATDVFPVTPTQHGMLFHTLLHPEDGLYVELFTCRLAGHVDLDLLKAAWDAVVQRHDILRSVFAWEGSTTPVHVVRARMAPEWTTEDWRELPRSEQRRRADELIAEATRRPFDFANGPLMRFAVLQLSDHEAQFVWTFHHVLLDGWSLAVVLREVADAYEDLLRGEEPARSSARPYAEYVRWLAVQDRDAAEEYWRETLADVSAPTPLGVDRPAAGHAHSTSREQTIQIADQQTAQLKAFAARHGVTLNTLLVGAWALLLSRLSGCRDVVYGTAVSGRPPELPGAETMVGPFINTVPVRLAVPDATSVAAWLRAIQAAQIRQRDHEHLPLVDVVRCSSVPHGVPLFESILVFENYPTSTAGAARSLTILNAEARHRSNYALAIVATASSRLTVRAIYQSMRIDDRAAARQLEWFQRLLAQMAASPDAPVGSLSVVDREEHAQIVGTWNATTRSYPRDASIASIFEGQAAARPDAVAVEWRDQALTYAALNTRANQVASALRRAGARIDYTVGIWLERGLDSIVALLGIVKAGAAYVALDPGDPPSRIASQLADARVRLVIGRGAAPAIDVAYAWVDLAAVAAEPSGNLGLPVPAEALAYVAFTSGSTGRPKGVAVTHRGVLRLVMGSDFAELGPGETLLHASPASFDASTLEIWGALLTGARLVLYPERVPVPQELGAILARHRVTTVWLTASLYNAVVDQAPYALRSVRQLLVGGEALSVAHVRRGLAALPATTLINGYGPTENTTFTCCYRVPRDLASDAPSIPLGGPIANTQVYVLDAFGSFVPVGVAGELYTGGDGLARGYIGAPRLTAERFVPDGVSGAAGARLYRTGDVVRWRDDGTLEFLGRSDGQLKLRGFRIELGEVEATLRALPGVLEAAATVRGEGDGRQLVAYVVPAAGAGDRDPTSWRTALQQRLPHYMVPNVVVPLPSLPRTAHGKLDRAALPDPAVCRAGGPFAEPATATERDVARIWCEVLRVERAGRHDNFFALGGHSLLATQIVSRLREAFAIELPLIALFDRPTIEALAAEIDRRCGTRLALSEDRILPADRNGKLLLSSAQERLWFLDQLAPDSAAYNVPTALSVDGPVDGDALDRAFAAIVSRHELLRTAFVEVDGAAVQRILPAVHFALDRVDLRHLSGERQSSEIARLSDREAFTPFDLTAPPLVRGRLVRVADTRHVLLLTLHHIVCDAWSMGVFTDELMRFYASAVAGRSLDCEPLRIQYVDFAQWQRARLDRPQIEEEAAYWTRRLAGVPTVDLPTDRPRPPVQTFRGSYEKRLIPKQLVDPLDRLGQEEGATPFITALTAFKILLSRYSGQSDIAIGTPVARRDRGELEPLIGFFSNTLVLRTMLTPRGSFRDALRRVRETALEAYAHQEVPFDHVVDRVQPERHLDRHPLFQVLFTLQHQPVKPLALAGVELRPLDMAGISMRFDLEVHVADTGNGLLLAVFYNTHLFDRESIARMGRRFETLLASIGASPDSPIEELELLPEDEKRQMRAWNDTGRSTDLGPTINQIFEAQVARTPDAVAVEFHNLQLTYEQLNAKANQLAHCLRGLGVGSDDRVAIGVERCLGLMVCVLGVIKAGAAYVPLDASYPNDRLRYMLENSGAKVLVTQEHLLRDLTGGRRVKGARRVRKGATPAVICIDRDWDTIAAQAHHDPVDSTGPDNLAYVLYTSGSTGRPKGVAMPHQPLINLLAWQLEVSGERAAGRTLQYAPLSFDPSFLEMFSTWAVGGTVVEIEEELRRDFFGLVRFLDDHAIERLYITPAALHQLADASHSCGVVPRALREVNAAGERLEVTPQIARFFAALDGGALFNQYGPTESHVVTAETLAGDPEVWPSLPSIGRALPNTRVHVLDADRRPVPIGVTGELFIAGECLARGYLDNPRLTADRFIPDPAFDGIAGRLYRTGDLARLRSDGTFEYLGRCDDQIKIRGYRVELGEVEAVLRQHPGVLDAAVAARDSGRGLRHLVAYVVPREGHNVEVARLRSHCAHQLPEYMVPAMFEALSALPLTPSGKVDRARLPDPLSSSATTPDYLPPRNTIERKMAEIWAEILGVDRIGIQDNFFHAGGHSLLAAQVISRVRREWEIELPMRALFECPTVAGLADRLQTMLCVFGAQAAASHAGQDREEGHL